MAATPKSCVLDVENMTIAQLEEAIGGIKLAQGKSLHADKNNMSEAVWDVRDAADRPVMLITSPVVKKFGVNILYQGRPQTTFKPKIDFALDPAVCDVDKLKTVLRLLYERLSAQAQQVIPAQCTGADWKNDPKRVERKLAGEEVNGRMSPAGILMKLGKPSKDKNGKPKLDADGNPVFYEDTITAAVRVPSEADRAAMKSTLDEYTPPPKDQLGVYGLDAKNVDVYQAELKKLPPPCWNVKVMGPDYVVQNGKRTRQLETQSNDILVGRKRLVCQLMIDISSIMIKPASSIYFQMQVRQIRVLPVDTSKGRVDDAELDTYWQEPKTEIKSSAPLADDAAGAGPDDEDAVSS